MQVIVKQRQSLPDITLQECGELQEALVLSKTNNLGLTEDLSTGDTLFYPVKRDITSVLSAKKVYPATAISKEDEELVPYGGVNFMAVEMDFIVS